VPTYLSPSVVEESDVEESDVEGNKHYRSPSGAEDSTPSEAEEGYFFT
jgi:hypothetical protein